MDQDKILKIHCDGGARGNPGPGASAFVASVNGVVIANGSKFLPKTTNNFAEYTAVVLALEWLQNTDYNSAVFILDSELVARQLNGVYKVKNDELRKLYEKVKGLEEKSKKKITYKSVPREKNKIADTLVNKTIDNLF